MADPKEPHRSFEDVSFGIGQNTDGGFNIFSADDLAERIAQRDSDEAADDVAITEVYGVDEESDADMEP